MHYNFTRVFLISVKFEIYFLGFPWEIVFSVVTDNYIYFEHFDISGLKYSGTRLSTGTGN